MNDGHDYSGFIFKTGDVNGDGRDDLIAISHSDRRIIVWKVENGNSFSQGEEWFKEN